MIAFFVICDPQVGPTSLTGDVRSPSVCVRPAENAADLRRVALCCGVDSLDRSAWTWMRRSCPLSRGPRPPAAVTPAASTAFVAVLTDRPLAVTSQEVPPLKSIPRLNPPVVSETSPATMMIPEIRYQILRRPTKSNDVSPR